MATPIELRAYIERDGQLVQFDGGYQPFTLVLVTIQAIAGLVPALVPGVLACLARRLVMRSRTSA